MVVSLGMSRLGSLSFDRQQQPLIELGPGRRETSEATAREIDAEVRRIIDEQHTRVMALLRRRLGLIHRAAERLLERESMSGAELEALCDEAKEEPHGKDDPRQAA